MPQALPRSPAHRTLESSTPSPTLSSELLDRHRRVHRAYTAIGKATPIARLDNLAAHHKLGGTGSVEGRHPSWLAARDPGS